MQSHRLARLLQIIVEVRAQPDNPPDRIAKAFGISTRQFYYDRDQLAQMGFRFSREKGRFTILRDPVVTIGNLPLSELLALVLATRHLFATRDFSVVRRALTGLYNIIDRLPESRKQLLRSVIQGVIINDGFGCRPDVFEDIVRAVDEKRRILVHFRRAATGSRTALDPFALCFKKSKLFLDAYAVERKRRRQYRLGTIDKIVFTPFYRPEYSGKEGT
ncbi:MAG: WYL domain-containing protein [Desulfobacterales bacterium]|nr:WYL domain-containing protein [Desulfobacterales bacterium]